MSSTLLVDRARSVSTGIHGRALNSVRTNHFVVDHAAYAGGPGEAPSPAETFLTGISACGVLLVQARAQEWGIPLHKAEVVIEGVRNADNPADFQRVQLRFELTGPSREQAERLVEAYKGR